MARRRVFQSYQRRFVPVAALITLVTTWLVTSAAVAQGGLAGLVLFAAFLWLVCDRLVLFGNRWLRRTVRGKVEALGELRASERAWFVGLAHPCHQATLRRRLIETDDDVGFLTIDWSGLHYRGDALHFDLPASDIVAVRMVHSAFAPWGRVELTTRAGEPFDALILSSRDFGSHAACRLETRRLYERLKGLCLLDRPLSARRLAAELEPLRAESAAR